MRRGRLTARARPARHRPRRLEATRVRRLRGTPAAGGMRPAHSRGEQARRRRFCRGGGSEGEAVRRREPRRLGGEGEPASGGLKGSAVRGAPVRPGQGRELCSRRCGGFSRGVADSEALWRRLTARPKRQTLMRKRQLAEVVKRATVVEVRRSNLEVETAEAQAMAKAGHHGGGEAGPWRRFPAAAKG